MAGHPQAAGAGAGGSGSGGFDFHASLTDELGKVDAPLLRHLERLCAIQAAALRSADDRYGGPAPTFPLGRLLDAALKTRLFGVLSLRSALFVWDQVLLVGVELLLPALCASLLVLLRGHLLACEGARAVARVLERHGPAVTVRQLQQAAERSWLASVREKLGLGLGLGGAPPAAAERRGGGVGADFILDDLAKQRGEKRRLAAAQVAERLGLTAAQELRLEACGLMYQVCLAPPFPLPASPACYNYS